MRYINNIDWNAALSGAITFLIVFTIKQLLDLKLAHWWIKYFHWIPLRNYFRAKPHNISGKWEEQWHLLGTKSFEDPTKRHSHPIIKQMGHYCYAEFIADGITYGVFGTIMNDYLIGEWFDINDRIGYFGTFHLKIESNKSMTGKWLGHSKSFHGIREGDWIWKKL
jgi:hypothetical protein